jgi:hypothetical protein
MVKRPSVAGFGTPPPSTTPVNSHLPSATATSGRVNRTEKVLHRMPAVPILATAEQCGPLLTDELPASLDQPVLVRDVAVLGPEQREHLGVLSVGSVNGVKAPRPVGAQAPADIEEDIPRRLNAQRARPWIVACRRV